MSEQQVSKEAASSDNIKMNLSVEGEIAKKDIAVGVAGMFALKNIISNSPEMASAFKAALGAGHANALAAKILATDDVSRIVTRLSSTDEVLNVAGNLLPDSGQFFSTLGKPLGKLIVKGGSKALNDSEASDVENELGAAFGESEGFFEGLVFEDIAGDAVEAITGVTEVAGETGGEVLSTIGEFFSNLFS